MYKIECARGEDIARVIALLESCSLPAQDIKPGHMDAFLLMWEGEAMVACAGLEMYGEAALLRSVAVRPDLRGAGMGSQLVGAIEARAASNGVRKLYLLTTTAEEFFTRLGYERTDRSSSPEAIQSSREFQTLCPSSAVCMAKTVTFQRLRFT